MMVVNKLKWKYIIFSILMAILVIVVWDFVQKTSDSLYKKNVSQFRIKSWDAIDTGKKNDVTDYYITNKITPSNRYYIDTNSELWGYGYSEYGQLGNDTEFDDFYSKYIKIASDVVSVDCSNNGYFCIFLTKDGSLFGMGSNMLGLLGQDYGADIVYSIQDYIKVLKPVLLMTDVSYARAGRESIVALKKDGSVWWWGQYRSTYSTEKHGDLSWQTTEDEKNPTKMLYNKPQKILDNCIYVTTGDTMGAAISVTGELYAWGLNIFGQCGIAVTEDDYLRKPKKVLENVKMVWPETILFNSSGNTIPSLAETETTYPFNTFVLLSDGTVMAAGKGLGNKEKTIAITGDLEQESSHSYSDTFVPIILKEYSETETREGIRKLKWRMTIKEVEQVLNGNGIPYSAVLTENDYFMEIDNSKYFLGFDQEEKLSEINLQVGGSRNQVFSLGMSLEEVKTKAGRDLVFKNDDGNGVYRCKEQIDNIYYGFVFNGDKLAGVFESETYKE